MLGHMVKDMPWKHAYNSALLGGKLPTSKSCHRLYPLLDPMCPLRLVNK